jgi:hypothetical protein
MRAATDGQTSGRVKGRDLMGTESLKEAIRFFRNKETEEDTTRQNKIK